MALSKIGTNSVSDSAVTTAKINDDAVTGAKIENSPTIAANLAVTGTTTLTGKATAQGATEGFGVEDKVLLNATDGSGTDAGSTLILDSTDGSADVGDDIVYEENTADASSVLSGTLQELAVEKLVNSDGTTSQTNALSENPAKTLVNYGQRTGGSYSVQIYSSTNVSSADDDAQGKHTFNLTNNVSSENGVQIVNGHNYDIDPTQNASAGDQELATENTSSIEGQTSYSGTLYDVARVYFAQFGDLA